MYKNRKILIVVLAMLLMLSIGYALFSETITINGTATAKGNFNIVGTCETGISSKIGSPEALGLKNDHGYANDTCTVQDNTVYLNTEFLYPSAMRYFTVKMTNEGDIDALLDANDVTKDKKLCVADNLNGDNLTCSTTVSSSGSVRLSGYEAYMYYDFAALEDPNGNLLSQSETLKYYDPVNNTIILKPGYSGYTYFRLIIDHEAEVVYDPDGEMFAEFTTSYKFPFTQYTE